MNMPLVLLNRRRRGTGFNPASLFGLNEQGVWYDPSDVANLAWRRNLLTYSEQFDNAVWTKTRTTISANAITAPDGTSTADKLVEDTSTNDHWVGLGPDDVAGAAYTASVFAKAGERGFVALSWQFESPTFFNLTTGAIGTQNPNYTASIVPLSDGWFRCSITRTAVSTSDFLKISVRNADGVASYTGDGTSGIYIWGAQFEAGSLTDYQRISDVNTEVIERFPTATMYQDAAGTTAVTTPGQPVGLRLDKSKGLVLGPEILTNGNFSGGSTGWTAGTTPLNWTFAGGAINGVDASGGYQNVGQVISGKSYVAEFTISGWTTGSVSLENAGAGAFGAVFSGDGVKRQFFTAAATATIGFVRRTSNFTGSLDNFSVKELPGNHATQSVLASRPVYGIEPAGGRRNLLTFSEQFDNAVWNKQAGTTVTANQAIAPDGTTTADLIVGNGTNGLFLSPGVLGTGSIATTKSIYLRGVSGGEVVVLKDAAATVATLTCNLTTSWQRFQLSETVAANSQIWVDDIPAGGVYIWGAQLELGSTATPYQRVTSAFDVTEAGVQTCHYVQYDGSDDGMITNSIDFTATDKMSVFAGVRKLSDAAYPTVVELSSNSDTLDGSFLLSSSRSSTLSDYYFQSRGTLVSATLVTGSIPAPSSNVIVGLGDISGDRATLRVNGVQVAQSTGNQGTGNFGNYPLYLGRRGGASLPFNGRDYGIVVVGKATTADEITATERWLSGKTGITI